MSHQISTIDEQTLSLECEIDKIRFELTEKVLAKLKHYDWMEQMRSKVEGYIRADKTTSISSKEIFDFIVEDAYKSFPQNIKDELKENSRMFVDRIGQLSSLGIGPKCADSNHDDEDK